MRKRNGFRASCLLLFCLGKPIGKEERWKVSKCQIEIVWVFSLPLMFDAIENHALDGCPGIEKEGRFQRRKAMGRDFSVIHGSPIGKPYQSSVASLRSLDFSNLAN